MTATTGQPLSPVPAGSNLKAVPGDRGLPLVGLSLAFMRDPISLMRSRYDQYGAASWASLFGIRMVQLIGPEANEFVFRNRDDMFSNNRGWDYFIGKFFHRGIMLLDFEEHRWHRKIMQQAFNRDVLKAYIDRMISPPTYLWARSSALKQTLSIKRSSIPFAPVPLSFASRYLAAAGPEA